MFGNDKIKSHIESSASVHIESAVIAEWNLNIAENIEKIGNYRYRPLAGPTDKYGVINNNYDPEDLGYYYTDATEASVVLNGSYDEDDSLTLIKTNREKEKDLFSLQDCFQRFRPRSGINKARYGINTKYLHNSNFQTFARPRYYMADKNDNFKYWSSARTEELYKYVNLDNSVSYGPKSTFVRSDGSIASGELAGHKERGVATQRSGLFNYIDDAAPFVVYKNTIPTNRIVVKMQTNVGSIALGDLKNSFQGIPDPLFGITNQTTPTKWKIQYLLDNSWVDAIAFDENSRRDSGSQIIGSNGYVEIFYGLDIPELFRDRFKFISELSSISLLPQVAQDGDAFIVKSGPTDLGEFYVWLNGGFSSFTPNYKWQLYDEDSMSYNSLVSSLVSPDFYTVVGSDRVYREIQYIRGIRVVVESMNKQDCSFDLIEISPRITADISSITSAFNISKTASDLGVSGMPVGQLLASVGSLEIFDSEQAFNPRNKDSIVKDFFNQNIQIKIFEVIKNVEGIDYFVPIKTMYADGFPEFSSTDRRVTIPLRDLLFYFESIAAPELMIPKVSLSYAIALLLDYAGFTNYEFYRTNGESDPVIPFFFVDSNLTLAEVLQQLAVSTQTAMFFDEYNNFVTMSREYIMPSLEQRDTDIVLYGSNDFEDTGVVKNSPTKTALANIIEVSQQEKNIFNDGKINFNIRYIRKSIGSIKQAYLLEKERRWVYEAALLWEVSASENSKSANGEVETSEAYALSAIPLNSNLSSDLPEVVNHQVINNIIDLGEAVYWLGRYNGFFYANGEIIKFDAVEFSITAFGTLWITSNQEYQEYFSKIPFNGKMYPTGRVRIYSEPNLEIVNGATRLANGPVAKHGRAQFGTKITEHFAGLNPYWKDNSSVRGYSMDSRFLFGPSDFSLTVSPAEIAGEFESGILSTNKAQRSLRTDVIKNFLSSSYYTEVPSTSGASEMVQASALTFEGPAFTTEESPINFISYVTKKISDEENKYHHFGTRMRVVGKIEADINAWQSPAGMTTVYNIASSDPEDVARIDGAGGGIGVLVNPKTNAGYYFEILAMNNSNLENYSGFNIDVHDTFFYKVDKFNTSEGLAAPVKLWSGLSNILVDDGAFTGQERVFASAIQTVYDLAVEYENIGSIRRFYLYLNGTQIATVDDPNPSPEDEHDNVAMFVRGSSRCMFENIYALRNNYSKNTSTAIEPVVSNAFASNKININQSFNKYAISGLIQSTYLSGVSPSDAPEYNIYYEEFGTIMREAAYFNIKYDKAYPALYAKISPTISKLRGYTVSGFFAGAYGAEFLVFNATDSPIVLDEKSGNYLRIQGVTFTQNSTSELTVDQYFNNKASTSKAIGLPNTVSSLSRVRQDYQDITNSRMTYGKKEFELTADYIQDYDSANSLMGWLIDKMMKPRLSVGVKIFANPLIQLGDIVKIDHSQNGIDLTGSQDKRFVVYNIEYDRSVNGPSMTLYLSEV